MRPNALIILASVLLATAPQCRAGSASDSVSVTAGDNDTETAVSVVQRTDLPSNSTSSSSHQSGRSSSSSTDVPGKSRVLAYGNILKQVKKSVPGDIVKVLLLQRQRNIWTYEFTILDSSGRLTNVAVNAQTAAIISKSRQ
jgi:uncharacterized membrane protein YkoI